jgi:hypothetical protein
MSELIEALKQISTEDLFKLSPETKAEFERMVDAERKSKEAGFPCFCPQWRPDKKCCREVEG